MDYTVKANYQSASAGYSVSYTDSENNERVKYQTSKSNSQAMCSRGCSPCNGCRH